MLSIWRRLAQHVWKSEQRQRTLDGGHIAAEARPQTPGRLLGDTISNDEDFITGVRLADLAVWCTGQPGIAKMQATDNRDRIFALLGIVCDATELNIQPDYEHSIEEVYIRTAAAMLRNGDYRPWYLSRPQRLNVQLPTWAVDWSAEFPTGSTRLGRLHRAGWGRKHQITFENTENGLPAVAIVQGATIGRVSKISRTWRECRETMTRKSKHMLPISLEWVKDFRKLFDSALAGKYDDEATHEATFRCIKYDFDDAMGMFGLSMENLYAGYKELLESLTLYLRKGNGSEVVSIGYIIKRNTLRRRGFITAEGLVGLAPEATAENDLIVVFAEAAIGFVLRDHPDGGFSLIGGCYVDSMMNGEAFRSLDNLENFKLR